MAMSGARGSASASMAETAASGLLDAIGQALAVAEVEVTKIRHDPLELAMRGIQPALWLLLFGEVMARVRGIEAETSSYLDYLAPGILAQSVLFGAIFYGIATIWERDLGILHRYLVSPAPRSALVAGKAMSAAIRGLAQGVIIYLLALVVGIDVDLAPLHVLGAATFIALGAGLVASLSVILACLVRTRERFMGMGQVITMPIFFASNAIYPIDLMPDWLRVVSLLNPLTYIVDALRALMLRGLTPTYGYPLDLGMLLAITAVLIFTAARLYPRMGS